MRLSKGDHWKIAQFNERDHWERLIGNCAKGGEGLGGERPWLNLWASQAAFLWPLINSLKNVTEETRILEIGGGAVGLIRWFEEGQLFALDPLGDLFVASFPTLPLDEYRLRKDMKYIVAPAEVAANLGFSPFDIVLLLNCLDHCRSPVQVLRSIHATLAKGGLLFESTTAFKQKYTHSWAYLKYHPWTWTEDELAALISGCGFELVLVTDEWPAEPGVKDENSNCDQILHVWKGPE